MNRLGSMRGGLESSGIICTSQNVQCLCIMLLKYKLSFYSDRMFIEDGAYTSHPPTRFYWAHSHRFTIH